jgi:predicted esterase
METASDRITDAVRKRTIVFTARPGVRRGASLIGPGDQPVKAGCLFVHWYEPEAADSNRTQFEAEAAFLAKQGVLSLLVETMWSDRDWFIKRTHKEDFQASLDQVLELCTALLVLREASGGEEVPVIIIGHDFGAMYGVLLGVIVPSLTGFILAAGTPRFADWYFYYPALTDEDRISYLVMMEPLDPVTNIGDLGSKLILFQFGKDDPHVPRDRAESFAAAAKGPKVVKWYDGGHALDEHARSDRLAWIQSEFKI